MMRKTQLLRAESSRIPVQAVLGRLMYWAGVLLVFAMPVSSGVVLARDQVHIVGSSTIYPFATVVAEYLGRSSAHLTPLVESTGSGGGLKLFCGGLGVKTPDIANASRRIKKSEFELCQKNGVKDIIEVSIGFDGIVLASSRKASQFRLSVRDIFLALAKDIPDPKNNQSFIPNPYKNWKALNPALPNHPIRVLGPPPTSGTRDAFAELAMEAGCKSFASIRALKKADKSAYKARCHAVREDGAWVEAGENDNLIVQKLIRDKRALGVFGYSFLQANQEQLHGSIVSGYAPDFKHIVTGDYPVARTLYFYVKVAHMNNIRSIGAYMRQFISARAMGEDGYLVERGLIPLPLAQQQEVRNIVAKGITLSL